MSKLILEEETHRILGACFEVYKEKGCGYVEPMSMNSRANHRPRGLKAGALFPFSVCSVYSVVVAVFA